MLVLFYLQFHISFNKVLKVNIYSKCVKRLKKEAPNELALLKPQPAAQLGLSDVNAECGFMKNCAVSLQFSTKLCSLKQVYQEHTIQFNHPNRQRHTVSCACGLVTECCKCRITQLNKICATKKFSSCFVFYVLQNAQKEINKNTYI